MKREKYFTALIIICISSYFMMFTMCLTVEAKENKLSSKQSISSVNKEFFNDYKSLYLDDIRLKTYISSISKLNYDDCEYLIRECKLKNFDPFIVLGLFKRESNFNPDAVGDAGERGLGQLMANTAKIVAKNLGYIYEPDKLFDTRYNIKLTVTQLTYLYNLYDNDINKALTAYNRGQQGLINYMNSESTYKDKGKSDYSEKVLKFAAEFKEEFVNLHN